MATKIMKLKNLFAVTSGIVLPTQNFANNALDEFKTTLMYFSEPYLANAHIRGFPLEGADSVEMGTRLVHAIHELEGENPSVEIVDNELHKFKKQLAAGVTIHNLIKSAKVLGDQPTSNSVSSPFNSNTSKADAKIITHDPVLLEREAVYIQNLMTAAISANEGLVLPFGWVGHALALVIKPGPKPDTFDLAFVNTGEGLESHYHAEDPNGIYPALSQVWIEFSGVPAEELFASKAWFVQVLILLPNNLLEKKLRKTVAAEDPLPVYFYGTFLANFIDYLVEPKKDRLIPMQRSGSCTLSSLMGALLYSSESKVAFHRYELKIGHVIMETFLERVEDDPEFKEIISDGYDAVGRKFFKGLASSMAQQALKYLENVLPKEFMHAGLIGKERFRWVFDKRDAAVKALSASENEDVLRNIQKSATLIRRVLEYLEKCPISKSSNLISLNEEWKESLQNRTFANQFPGIEYERLKNQKLFSDAYSFLAGVSDRTNEPIKTFEEFQAALIELPIIERDQTYCYKVLNVFKRAWAFGGKHWWRIIEEGDLEQLLKLQKVIEEISMAFKHPKSSKNSFENIVLAMNLQRLSWLLALNYDNKLPEDSRIGLSNLREPETVQSVLFGSASEKFHVLSGALKIWPIKNCFDPHSIEMFMELLEKDEGNYRETFVGPEGFCSADIDTFSPERPTFNIDLYGKMTESEQVKEILEELKSDSNWTHKEPEKAKFLIVFYAKKSKLEKIFPQYYHLMNTLALLRLGAIGADNNYSKSYWLTNDGRDSPDIVSTSYKYSNKDQLTIITRNYFDLVGLYEKDIFYVARHSVALSSDLSVVSFESWLNYVQVSESGKMFDSEYFQYLSDHILNIPKFDMRANIIFPVNDLTADCVIKELTRLIRLSLNELTIEDSRLTEEKRVLMVARSAIISVLLTRFIARIDSKNILNGKECARALANVYNTIHPFANLVSSYRLSDAEISKLHMALAHICSIPMRDSLTFMESIGMKGLKITLERFHWFIAKRHYKISGSNNSSNLADDQFNYGYSSNPLAQEETEFLQEILKTQFLPSFVPVPSELSDFRYHSNGFTVEIHSPKNPSANVMLNLLTGALVLNGICSVNKSAITSSMEFKFFFKDEDLNLAASGTAVEACGMHIYSLSNFKGRDYLLVLDPSHEGRREATIFMKVKGHWYQNSEKGLEIIAKELSIGHNWIIRTSKVVIRKIDSQTVEYLLFAKNASNPVLSFIVAPDGIKIAVEGLGEGNSWTIIDRKNLSSLQKHLHDFSDGDYILARDENGRIVIIYLGLRLSDDPNRPLVLLEAAKEEVSAENDVKSIFKVLNVPNMTVCSDQSLAGGRSIPGGLLVISNSKKIFLLPNEIRQQSRFYSEFVFVEKIPVLTNDGRDEGSLAPQSRFHKLLVAYNFAYTYNFDSARVLLLPSKSINNNEKFSEAEIRVLHWFFSIKSQAPEAIALKLFAVIHRRINIFLFTGSDALLGLDKNLCFNYLNSIRELPEKYYIFRIFPEALKNSMFADVFGEVPNGLAPADVSPDKNRIRGTYYSFYVEQNYSPKNFPIDEDLSISTIVDLIGNYDDLIKHYMHFQVRRIRGDLYTNYNSIPLKGPMITLEYHDKMAWICYVKEPELWASFKEKLIEYRSLVATRKFSNFTEITKSMDKISLELKDIMSENLSLCKDKCSKYFAGINQSRKMKTTSLETLKETMRSDAKTFKLEIESNLPTLAEVISTDDINRMKIIEEDLRALLTTTKMDIDLNQISSSMRDLEALFKDRIDENSIILSKHAAKLVLLTNENEHSALIGSILSLMHQQKVKTFESLYACYMRESLVCIQRKFPQLNLDQCKEVEKVAKVFFTRKVLIDYYTMLRKNVENFLRGPSLSWDDLNIFCDELSKIADFNERMKDPVIMNFEFRSGKYRLKPEQFKDVMLLSSEYAEVNRFESAVIQRMMAAGKTLVLGTISVVRKALKGDTLSILVPPSSLYQSNTTAMQTRTYSYFKKKGKTLAFPRLRNFDELGSLLNVVLDVIKEEIGAKDYLILSPDTLHSYLNSYIESLLIFNPEGSRPKRMAILRNILSQFAEIYRIFKKKGSIILDEIDMTMDPKKELNFPTRETEPYNMIAVGLLTDIMEFLVFDRAVINSGLKIHSNNQASLTKENYKKCLDLILDYIEAQLQLQTSLWYKLVIQGSSANEPRKLESIIKFLRSDNMAEGREWIFRFHNSGNSFVANALIIVKSQLHRHMEHSLKGTVNQNFGSAGNTRPEIKYAIPYAAANTPSTSSVFADRWETLLKTLLMISASPCSTEIVKEIIQYVRDAIPGESAGLQPMETTATFLNMKVLLPNMNPLSLDKNNSVHIKAVQRALAPRSPAAIRILFSYYIVRVFDKMTFAVEQISSNALNVASMFDSVQGYSGTIDNVNILPQSVIVKSKVDHDINEKNNHAISEKLINDDADAIVPELNDDAFLKSVEKMVIDVLELYPSEIIDNVSAIIDTGAFFKNFKNRQVTEAALRVSKGKFDVGLYYDEDSNQLEFVRLNADGKFAHGLLETTDPADIERVTDAKVDRRFTYYDQRHITGSDILQPKTGRALMTCGPRVLLRDILQGALRLRQFMSSQRVHFVTTASSREFFNSKVNQNCPQIRVSDIMRLGSINEQEKQEQENQKLAFMKIDSEIRAFVLEEISTLLADNTPEASSAVADMVKAAKPLLLRSIKETPLNWLMESKEEDTCKVLRLFAISRLKPLKVLLDKLEIPQNIQERFKSLTIRISDMVAPERITKYDSLLHYTKKTIRTPLSLESGTEVQQQSLILNLAYVEMKNYVDFDDSGRSPIEHSYKLLSELVSHENDQNLEESGKSDQYVSLGQIFNEIIAKGNDYTDYVKDTLISGGSRVGVTEDLVNFAASTGTNALKYPIFSKYSFEGSHLLIQLVNNNLKILLVSTKFADKVFDDLENYRNANSRFWLCNLSGVVSATNDEVGVGENVLDFIPQIKEMIFDILIFNGSLPHILANPGLKNIYYNTWLGSDNFQNRARFLLLRMAVLLEKDKQMFEHSCGDFEKLKKFSMGNKNSSVDGSFVDGYPKEPVSDSFERDNRILEPFVPDQISFSSETYRFDLIAEIRDLFNLAPGDAEFTKSGIEFGLQSVPGQENIDIDPREVTVKCMKAHPFIHVPDFCDQNLETVKSLPVEEFVENDAQIQATGSKMETDDWFPDFLQIEEQSQEN